MVTGRRATAPGDDDEQHAIENDNRRCVTGNDKPLATADSYDLCHRPYSMECVTGRNPVEWVIDRIATDSAGRKVKAEAGVV